MTKEEIQQSVDALAPWHYNHIFPFGISTGDSPVESIHPKLAELLRVGAFTRKVYPYVLDLGANSGLISMWFADNKQSKVVAVEGNPRYYQQLELAVMLKGYDDKVIPDCKDLHNLDFAEGIKYDLVLLLGTLHHIKPELHLPVLKACFQACAPAGEIIVQTVNTLPVDKLLIEAGFIAVHKLEGTAWHDRAAWFGFRDPMKLW